MKTMIIALLAVLSVGGFNCDRMDTRELNNTVYVEDAVVDIEDEEWVLDDWEVVDFTFRYTYKNRD